VATLTRKNLMVDAERLKRLAKRLGMNESETVRYAVNQLLLEEALVNAAATIRRHGGLEDVFGRTKGDDAKGTAAE